MNSNNLLRYLSIVLITYVGAVGVTQEAQQVGLLESNQVVGVAFATPFSWDTANDGQWDNDGGMEDNWTGAPGAFPGTGDNATHDDTYQSRIQVDSDEVCYDFDGDGDAPNDRFLLIDAEQTLEVENDMFQAGGSANYKNRFEDGSSGNLTTVDVTGDVTEIDFVAARENDGDYLKVDVGGNVDQTSLTFRHHSEFLVGGDITDSTEANQITVGDDGTVTIDGDVSGVDMTFGTSAASSSVNDTTTIEVDEIGTTSTNYENTCTLRGYADLDVTTRIRCDNNGASPSNGTFVLENYASIYAATSEEIVAPTIIRGGWTLSDNATVETGDETFNGAIGHGHWSVSDSASVDANWRFFPYELMLNGANASVTAEIIGWGGDLGVTVPWDLTIAAGASVTATGQEDTGIPVGGVHPGIGHPTYGSNSSIQYKGTGNTYSSLGYIDQGGTFVNDSGNSALTISSERGLLIATELGIGIDFDTEGVTVELGSSTYSPQIEAFSPDYSLSTNDPLFTDSPCVKRWGSAVADSSNEVDVTNAWYTSTDITCTGTSCGGDEVPEALYVIDLEVTSGTDFQVNGLNVYYTGAVTNNGTIKDGGSGYSPIELVATLYGDFDADMATGGGGDADDYGRFNDAFPSEIGDAEYDHLVDFDCDGFIDCTDRAQFLTNYPEASGNLEDDNC